MRVFVEMLLFCAFLMACSSTRNVRQPSVSDYTQMSDRRLCSHVLDWDRTVRVARSSRGLMC